MFGWLKIALEWLVSKPSTFFGIGIICIVIVALPNQWQIYLGYNVLLKSYKGGISIVGISSLVLWLNITVMLQSELDISWNFVNLYKFGRKCYENEPQEIFG